MAFHAKPRFTKDIDLLVEPTAENAERLLLALRDYGFGAVDLTVQDFTTPGRIVQLGVPVCYIGKAELVRNKRATGRAQDFADLEALE